MTAKRSTAQAPAARKPRAPRQPKAAAPDVTLVVNRYDAAGNGRRMAGWNAPGSGPNRAIQGIEKLRNRNRDSARNDWATSAGVQRWTTTLIGTGIVPRFNGIKSESQRQTVTDLFESWVKQSDADGNGNFYAQQTLAAMTWFVGGECLPRLRYRRPGSGLPVNLQVQLLEGEMVPMLDADNWPGMPTGNRIRSGRELDRIGRTVAWWVYKDHPGDAINRTVSTSDLVRVTADQMMHIFEPKRPGQLRGVPDAAPVLAHLRNIMDFNDAVLERQKLANLFAAFIKKPALGSSAPDRDPITGQLIGQGGTPIIGLEPGLVQELLPGEEVQFANPPEAGTMFSEYMRTQHTYTAAGQNLPYELMSGDIQNVSDRTLRIVIQEFRRYAEQRQWQIMIPRFCQPVVEAWVDQGVLDGTIPASLAEQAKKVEWQPQGWAYIHPVQDVQAKALEVEKGFRSRSSVIAERGDDPNKVDAERKADKEREDKLGIAPQPPSDPAAKPGAQPANKPVQNAVDHLTMSVARLETAVLAARNEPKAEQPINVHAHIAAPNVTVSNTVPVPEVKVENTVPVPEVKVENTVEGSTVNVSPTPVNVMNSVPAPVVNVTNEVSVDLPDRETTSVIERDGAGNITNVTQTERTIN